MPGLSSSSMGLFMADERLHQDFPCALAWIFDTWELAFVSVSLHETSEVVSSNYPNHFTQREEDDLLGYKDPRTVVVAKLLFLFYRGSSHLFLAICANFCWFSDRAIRLMAALSFDPEKYSDGMEFLKLFWRTMFYCHSGPRRAWRMKLFNLGHILDSTSKAVEQVGCMNLETCPRRERLQQVMFALDEADSDSLSEKERGKMYRDFGETLRMCGG
jgi:hypothetical protein